MNRNEQIARLLCSEIIGCEWDWLFKDEADKLNMGRRKDTPPDWNMPTQKDFLDAVPAVVDALAKVPPLTPSPEPRRGRRDLENGGGDER